MEDKIICGGWRGAVFCFLSFSSFFHETMRGRASTSAQCVLLLIKRLPVRNATLYTVLIWSAIEHRRFLTRALHSRWSRSEGKKRNRQQSGKKSLGVFAPFAFLPPFPDKRRIKRRLWQFRYDVKWSSNWTAPLKCVRSLNASRRKAVRQAQ